MTSAAFKPGNEVYVNATGGFRNAKGEIRELLGDYGAVVYFPNSEAIPGQFRFLLSELSHEPTQPPVTQKQLTRARAAVKRAQNKLQALEKAYSKQEVE